jgi:molybdate transport system substrate-binding protein
VRAPSRSGLIALAAAALLALGGCSAPSQDDREREPDRPLAVYAAASLAGALDRMTEEFTRAHPRIEVRTVYDGSATLATQIAEGAPADVFAAADEASMARVGDAAVDPTVIATNTLVLAVPAGNPAGVASLSDLADVTVVLCAPEVPCGASSAALLAAAGVDLRPASLEQNVTAVLTKVAAGDADAGLVYATDVRGRDDVEAIVPDEAAQIVNRYPIAALDDAARPADAADFVAFVRSDAGMRILAEFGFGAP